MERNLWRRGWCGRSGILVILLLLLAFLSTWSGGGWSGSGGGGVSAQLYTSIDKVSDAVKNMSKQDLLPLGPLKPDYTDSSGNIVSTHWPEYPQRTCMVPIKATDADDNTMLADDHSVHKGLYQVRYFCVGIPRFHDAREGKEGKKGSGPNNNAVSELSRTHSPYSYFWIKKENTVTGWQNHQRNWEKPEEGGDGGFAVGKAHQDAKDKGLIFRIDVTGIKSGLDKDGSGGRFLKGWYHLKISLDIDHNIKNKDKKAFPETADQEKLKLANEYKNDYVIDKLIVSARGRSLTAGRPRDINGKLVKRPPRRMWVGGIGEFVQDFPKCKGKNHNVDPFVYQQFMSCGTVAYAESKYGNNFYYSRSQVPGGHNTPEIFGGLSGAALPNSDKEKNEDVIHLNFRLDISFCNRYYDVDFVATGMASQKKSSSSDNVVNSQPILRSISTRFTFVSSYEHHYPDYYENADPVPRHEKEVDCDQELKGEWEMNKDLTDKDNNKHRMSVTAGAAMKLTGASPDATFFGAFKFVTNVPENLTNITFNKEGVLQTEDNGVFLAHRTWVNGQRLLRWSTGRGYYHNPWRGWNDINGLPKGHEPKKSEDEGYDDIPIYLSAVQRVLNEFDWETWVERRKVVGISEKDKQCFKVLERVKPGKTDIESNDLARSDEAGYWPHPYYDVTCGGLDVFGEKERIWGRERPNEFHKAMPPITGRCVPSLWKVSGFGDKDYDPPKCNEFFYESRLWTDWKGDTEAKKAMPKGPPRASSDPALAQVVKAVNRQLNGSRTTWNFAYLSDHSKAVQKVICDKADLLEEEYPDCLFIGAKPYTPRNPTHHPPTQEEQEAIDYAEKARLEFKRTPAYKRGMLVNDSPYSMYIWDSRLVHGLFATVITLFVTPVSIFMTRYFKETFMDTRIFLHHIWYFVHIGASFATQLLFLISMWRQSKAHELLGYSLGGNSKFHRVAGWLAIGISAFSFFFGGLRTMNRKMRAATMVVHFFAGWIFYLLCLACVMSSLAIPGSPAAYEDYTTSSITGDFQKSLIEPVLIAVVVWFLFDIIMHVIMTILQCRNDKKMLLTRSRYYHLSPMPVIAETFRFDTPGRFPRIYLLCIYVLVSLAATITACVFMYNYSPRGRGLGFMSCTHSSAETGHEVYTEFPKDC